jgi:acetate kinase
MSVPYILTLNAGSSSIKFALFETDESYTCHLSGKIDRIGLKGAQMVMHGDKHSIPGAARDHSAAVRYLMRWLEGDPRFGAVKAVGHRVVHGMKHVEPKRVTAKLMSELRRHSAYAPDHLPREIGLIQAFARRYPTWPQVACFDTAFHRSMPAVAKRLSIPRRYGTKGVERYGFHGISYAYLMEELGRQDPKAARGRVILAHLGNGASVAAVREGRCQDTSMGFTPTAGLVMSTRSGDLDPGLAYYLARTERMSAARFQKMVNHESGLLGVSGTSPDIRDLCAREATDPRAAEAVELFCYQARKQIGAYAAALGGVETIVFSAGIGENSPSIRQRICAELGFLGVELDPDRNAGNAGIISAGHGRVAVRVIRTNEELMIARYTARALQFETTEEK